MDAAMQQAVMSGRGAFPSWSTFNSWFVYGTRINASNMREAIEASGAEVVTVAVRRVSLPGQGESLLDYVDPKRYTLLPNTAGCYTADEAVRTGDRDARRREAGARVRGIGASPANPGVMTYVDGVPQFSSNSSSFDLIDVGQVEFVRGPQSPLFGRNTLGGIDNEKSTFASGERT